MSLLSWRLERKMSLQQVADLLTAELRKTNRRRRVAPETIRRYEIGTRRPRADEMRALVAVTGGAVDANSIYGITPANGSQPGGAAAVATAAALPKPGQKPGPKLRGSAGRPATVLRAAARKAARKTAEMRKRRLAQREARA